MPFTKVFALMALAGFAAATPVPATSTTDLVTRGSNCINPVNMPWGQTINCPHTNTMDSNGVCFEGQKLVDGQDYCSSYCETRVYWEPGAEVPFPNSACMDGGTCTFAQAKATATTKSYTVNLGFNLNTPNIGSSDATAVLTSGISYNWYQTSTFTTTTTFSPPANSSSSCGYWTFVPALLTSCGSISFIGTTSPSGPTEHGVTEYVCNPQNVLSTTGNWCNTSPYEVDGQASGDVIFVNLDCEHGGLLPMDKQPWLYQQPGVAQGVIPARMR